MATLVVNDPNNIQFVNIVNGTAKNVPTLIVEAGDWETGKALEPGVLFDVSGDAAPLLTANDARKLAKWLTRAADALDGVKNSEKKRRPKNHYETDDDEFDAY